ncbi:MAG: transglutaminaseTgpA domain-containing protein [Alcanivorax sp.]|uniref:transglutaminase family protein n=1 Tax=Alcanivorax sp. TaxID=1872427 RepID=UPI003DA76F59
MARIYQVPSHTRLWLALAVVLCSMPQLVKGPLWQAGLLLLVILIRWLVEQQRLTLPGRMVRSLLLIGAVALTFYSFGRLYGPQAGVALLVSLFALKYLEVVQQRDAYVVIVLGYFVCATALLFSQTPGMFLYVVLCMTVLTTCLVGINHSDTRASGLAHGKRAVVITLQAVPLMVVLFLLVPRVAPLWNMQVGGDKARTGMSDSMSPGQISELSESAELAFRVDFQGDVPPRAERYWRGLTLSHYDGRTWQQAVPQGQSESEYLYQRGKEKPDWYQRLESRRTPEQRRYRYQVIVEPTQRRWLFSLDVPFPVYGDVALAKDMRLVSNQPVSERFAYRVESVPAVAAAINLTSQERQLMLSIPDEAGRQARGLAQQWRLESDSPSEIAQRALRYFREQPFHYTLRPPRLTMDPVDDFLFRTRRGFCEHYASSFTFLMRAAGVPARVVVGYQGGERNALGSHLLVRQYDAHAWSEIWLEGQGWIRVDPTGAVAPERIELGLWDALENSEDGRDLLDELGLRRFSDGGLFAKVSQWMDYVDFRWQTWVLGYDRAFQSRFLEDLLGAVTPVRIAIALIAAVAMLMGLYALFLLWQTGNEKLTLMEREYWRLHQRASERGRPLEAGLTPMQLCQAISEQWPQTSVAAENWAKYYQKLHYDPLSAPDKQQKRHLRSLRNRLYKLLD